MARARKKNLNDDADDDDQLEKIELNKQNEMKKIFFFDPEKLKKTLKLPQKKNRRTINSLLCEKIFAL